MSTRLSSFSASGSARAAHSNAFRLRLAHAGSRAPEALLASAGTLGIHLTAHISRLGRVTVAEVHIRNLKVREAEGRIKMPTTSQSSTCSLLSGATALNRIKPGQIGS
jgi:hypothetical protein